MFNIIKDKEIIQLFFKRSERAIYKLNEKYGKLFCKLSYNILRDRSDSEECVNDTYLGVWKAIPPAIPDPLVAFVCKIVRNLSLKRLNMKTAKKRNSTYELTLDELEEYLPSAENVESEVDVRELTQIIEGFLGTLIEENRVIFMRRYWFADTYEEIAKCVGLSEKNVSVRLTRMRKQLKCYLTERGVSI